ncbi:hypothetical protein ACFQHV_01180 [Promicromonospora thailandica]|nr:hypothetical protein [Promicromonospora thailandica]
MEQQTVGGETVTLAEYVDLKRRRRSLTWEQLATVVGVRYETLVEWRKENWGPIRLKQAVVLAKALDMDPRRFFEDAA